MKNPTRRDFLRMGALAMIGTPFVVTCSRYDFDLLILGAELLDGTGGPTQIADVGVRGDRIAAIGDLSRARAKEVVRASGLALSPGFIDVHTHTDVELLVDGRALSKVQQGVTTEISGNCGESPFPLCGEEGERARERWRRRYGIEARWTDAAGFLSELERVGISFNYATFVGHGTVRGAVMGQEDRPPSHEELERMRGLVHQALEQGAVGLSTGLEYSPGAFAKPDEIVELVRIVEEPGGVYATHMRNEDVRLLEAIDEALSVARETGCSLQISHLKASQPRNWSLLEPALQKIRSAADRGLNVHADRYPYTAFGTTAQVLFPMWSREGGPESFVGRLNDEAVWSQMAAFAMQKVENLGGWQNILISRIPDPSRRVWQGQRLDDLARRQGQDPLEFLRQLLVDMRGDVSIVAFAMSEENLEKVLAFPRTMIGSDGNAVSPQGVLGESHPHPRFYGTFPRVLGRYVRDRKVLSLEEAVHRMTSLPAEKFGFVDRGVIRPGAFADLVLFDPDRVRDRATFDNPHQFPEGIHLVVVNGTIVVREGEHTGARPGRVLRRGRKNSQRA